MIAWGVVEHDEIVRLDDVADKPHAEIAFLDLLDDAEDARAEARVVVDHLVPYLVVVGGGVGGLVEAAAGDGSSDARDVGRHCLESAHG